MVGTNDQGMPHDPAGSCFVLAVLIEVADAELVPRAASQTRSGVSDDEFASVASVSGVVDTMTMDGPSSE